MTTIHPFAYHAARSLDDAAARLHEPGAMALGGGTDLLVLVEEGLARPERLVDLRRIPGSRGIERLPDGAIRIGASARIDEIARSELVRETIPALAEACEAVGTPALRAMGTIGGNLCQRPRCWYFRRGIPCLKNGGETCPAVEGENQYLAILEGGPCHIVHPSDPAVALTALEAVVEVAGGRDGTRRVPVADFFVLPAERLDAETVLAPGELVAAVEIPAGASGVQRYHKLMQRDAWDFALVSLAAARRENGDVRLVLGGVAPRPYRVNTSIEEDVASGNLDEQDVATLADRALYDARPLSRNAYKLDLAAALLRRGIGELLHA
ncbi:MAG TPA: FAD binding domain-containing protein [Gemmatimonadaceae bacterium]